MSTPKDNLSNMLCLDIYLESVGVEKHESLRHLMKPLDHVPSPLMSWDISGKFYWEAVERGKKRPDIEKLIEFSQKYDWNIDLENLLQKYYQTLVLTDPKQVICWVNKGFKEMTGYPANFAIGKTPGFLQGKNTSPDTKENIRQQLQKGVEVSEKIINYRKNGEEYLCEVKIFPVKNSQGEIIHFLALENEAD